jgi:hypothetical protein
MNKRGDVTVTMLVIGVFAVCTLALISFFQSSVEIRNSFVGLDLVEKMNADIESYGFSQKDNLKDLAETNKDGLNLFSEEKKTTTGFWLWEKEKTLFYLGYNPK